MHNTKILLDSHIPKNPLVPRRQHPLYSTSLTSFLALTSTSRQHFLIGGGNVPYSTSTRETVARAIFPLLTNSVSYEEAKNKYIHIAAYTVTQN